MIPLARRMLVHDWRRFMPAALALCFSGLLLAVQVALVLGIFGSAAVSVTASSADLWVGYPGTQSVNFGRAVSADVEMRLRMDPQITEVEPYLWLEADWQDARRAGGGVPVFVSGVQSAPGSMMFSRVMGPALRAALAQPGSVVVDRSDLRQLGAQPGEWAWINGQRVQVLAAIDGLRALGGVNVLASLDTARALGAPGRNEGSTYFVAAVARGSDAAQVQQRLGGPGTFPTFGAFEAWTAPQFARRSQLYWMLDTGAGAAVLFMAAIVCLVGVVITSQSLTSVVAASAREYATLHALGVSMRSLGRVVVQQACWIGGLGLLLALVASSGLIWLAASYGVPVAMTLEAALGCAGLVAALALLSGLVALRGLFLANPAMLLR